MTQHLILIQNDPADAKSDVAAAPTRAENHGSCCSEG